MNFRYGDRVEMATCNHKGTVEKDDGQHVWVKWDDGQTGILKYDRAVLFSAYRLHKLSGIGKHGGVG